MAAVATAPVALSPARTMRRDCSPRLPWRTCSSTSALTPRDSLPLLAVSGVTGKAFWIGSLPQPPMRRRRRTTRATATARRNTSSMKARRSRCARPTFPSCCLPTTPGRAKNPRRRRSHGRGLFFLFFPVASTQRENPSRRERTTRLSRRHVRSRSALTDLRFAISPSPEKQGFKIAKLREERREEAEMYRLAGGRRSSGSQVEDRLMTSERRAKRKKSPSARGRASRVWEGVRRRGPTTNTSKRASTGSGTPGGGIAAGAAWFRSRCSSPRA